jgi:hypothetical protein
VAAVGHRRTRRTSLRLLGSALLGGVLPHSRSELARAAQIDAPGPPPAGVSLVDCAAQRLTDRGRLCTDILPPPQQPWRARSLPVTDSPEAFSPFLGPCPVSRRRCPVSRRRACQPVRKNGESSPCAPCAGSLGSIVLTGVHAIRPRGSGADADVTLIVSGQSGRLLARGAAAPRDCAEICHGRRTVRSPDPVACRVPAAAAIAKERRRNPDWRGAG